MRVYPFGKKEVDAVVKGICRKGLRKSELTLIAGAKDTGKSIVVSNIVEHAWEDTDLAYIVHNEDHAKYEYFSDAGNLFLDKDTDEGYYFAFAKSISVPILLASLNDLHNKNGFELLVIDGLEVFAKARTPQDRTWLVQDLKNFVKEIGATLLLTAQLPQDATVKPTVENLEVVFYPGLADMIVFLYDTGIKNEVGDATYKAAIAKSSSGQTAEYEYVIRRTVM
jgi:KaiC/GvpD/RAD55 family RecA-like ATPase